MAFACCFRAGRGREFVLVSDKLYSRYADFMSLSRGLVCTLLKSPSFGAQLDLVLSSACVQNLTCRRQRCLRDMTKDPA
jgi:hypothetical protein